MSTATIGTTRERTYRRGQTYRLVFRPDHPNAPKSGWVMEHRLVMEAMLGRLLDPAEVVHHKDRNGLNNNPSNLVLVANKGIHLTTEHASEGGRASAASRPICACGARMEHGEATCWGCWSRSQTCPTCGRHERKMARRDMCHGCYKAMRKRTGRLPPFNPRATPDDVYLSHVDRSAGPDGCWPWTASISKSGHGYAPKGCGEKAAHRVAWRRAYGPAGNMLVRHRCGNRRCCNPAHLYLGTVAEVAAARPLSPNRGRGPEHGERVRRGRAAAKAARSQPAPPNENAT